MMARIWHGRVVSGKADAYMQYMEATGLRDYRATPGNRDVIVLRRAEGDVTHFLVLTFWDSLEAIKAFAGPHPEKAVYYPEDDAFLLEKEPHVTHYEVLRPAAP